MAKQKPDEILEIERFYGIALRQVKRKEFNDYDKRQKSFVLDDSGVVIRLDLSECNIKDLSPLASLTQLTELY